MCRAVFMVWMLVWAVFFCSCLTWLLFSFTVPTSSTLISAFFIQLPVSFLSYFQLNRSSKFIETFHDKYGPISELFRSALHFFCPLVLHIIAVMLYFQYRYTFDYEKSGLMSKILELLVPAAPSYVLAAFIGIDVGKILYLLTKRRHRSTIWNLFYLTEEHPSYRRTMLTYHMEKIDRQEESTKQTR